MRTATQVLNDVAGRGASNKVYNVDEVIERIGFEVAKKPLALLETPTQAIEPQAIVRTDTGAVLGVVSPKYKLIRHSEVMQKPLEILSNEKFTCTKVGIIDSGAKVALELRGNTIKQIAGDNYFERLILVNSYDTSASFQAMFGFFRQICSNGAGIWDGAFSARIIHKGEKAEELMDYTKFMNYLSNREQVIEKYATILGKLGGIKIPNRDRAQKVLEQLKFGPRVTEKILDEWKKKINYENTLLGLYHGITSYYSRKVEGSDTEQVEGSAEIKSGMRLLKSQNETSSVLAEMEKMVQ